MALQSNKILCIISELVNLNYIISELVNINYISSEWVNMLKLLNKSTEGQDTTQQCNKSMSGGQ